MVTVTTKYGSDGSKLQKQSTTTANGIPGPSTVKKTTDYLDGFQYLKMDNFGLIGMSAETMAGLETSRALERQAFSVEPMSRQPPWHPRPVTFSFSQPQKGFTIT